MNKPAEGLLKLAGSAILFIGIFGALIPTGYHDGQTSKLSITQDRRAPKTVSDEGKTDARGSSLESDARGRLLGSVGANQPDPLTRVRIEDAYGKLPLGFEKNHGQTDRRVKFLSRGPGYCLFLTPTEAVFALNGALNRQSDLARDRGTPGAQAVLRVRLSGANPDSIAEGLDQLPGNSNYFTGNNPEKWFTDIHSYSRVSFANVYPGVSLLYYGSRQQLEYDFIVARGADPSRIKLAFDGAKRISVDANGDLVLSTEGGDILQHKPVVYQITAKGRNEVPAAYEMTGTAEVGFAIGAYDTSMPLVIDPVVSYATYLGANNGAGIYSIAVDQGGNLYVTGNTLSTNFPVTAKAYRTALSSSSDVYVSKLNSTGTAFLFSSYLAGGTVYSIAADNNNNAYITGVADSSTFPTTPSSYQTTSHGAGDVFVAKINTNPASCTPGAGGVHCSQALAYSTFLGGSADDFGYGIAIDVSGNAYVAGQTHSSDFPITPGAFQPTYQGGDGDGFVAKVNPTGQALVYSSFLGGGSIHGINTGLDVANGIAVDSSGDAYVTGASDSASFPTTPGAFQTSCTNCGSFNSSSDAVIDAFVTKINASGTGLAYSTYLGGHQRDVGSAIAVDSSGNAYVTGRAVSSDFPTSAQALKSGNGGVLKSIDSGVDWNATGSGLAISSGDSVTALAIDPANPSTIYSGVYRNRGSGGVFKSTDRGDHWVEMSNGLTGANVIALALAPTVAPTLYAGFETGGVYKSTDGGEHWFSANTGLTESSIASLVVDPRDPLVIFAGGNNSGVYKSIDGGAHWSYTGGPGANTLCMAFDPLNPSILYAGRTNSVDRSTDGGATWEYIGEGISSQTGTTVRAFAVDPTATAKLYAGTDKGIFKSIDGASTPWQLSSNGLTSLNVRALAIDPANTSTIYAGTLIGVFKSIDGGMSWKASNKGMSGALVAALALDPANTKTVYAGSQGNSSIFVTKVNPSGNGLSYSTFLGGIATVSNISTIALDSFGNAYVAGTTPGGFTITQDAFQQTNVGDDAFLAKIDATGTQLLFATYLGGSDTDSCFDVATDSAGGVYVAGVTSSSNFPTTVGVVQRVKPGLNFQGFIAKMTFPTTANYDQYSTGPNTQLSVSIPGVLGNDTDITQSSMTAVLVSGVSSGSLALNGNGSFSYTPNSNFVGYDSFKYKAQTGSSQSNIAQVVIAVGATSQCSAVLSSTGQALPAAGGTGSVDVTAQCSWNAFSNVPSFIAITSGASGVGNGTVQYSVSPNSSTAARVGTMTIAGQTFTVTQSGQPASLGIDSLSPPAGRASGGQQVVLAGSFTSLSTVTMGGVSASFVFSSGTTQITVTTPPHAVGAVDIVLTPTSGSPFTKTNAFAYLPTVFTDDTIVAASTMARAQHIIELRQAVDALRAVAGLGPAPWSDNTLLPSATLIKAVHITELRSFLENAATMLGFPSGSYMDPGLSSGFVIKRVHIEELRQRIRNIAG